MRRAFMKAAKSARSAAERAASPAAAASAMRRWNACMSSMCSCMRAELRSEASIVESESARTASVPPTSAPHQGSPAVCSASKGSWNQDSSQSM